MTDIMLDLETFGTRPGAIIRSVGACTFSLTSEKSDSTYSANIEVYSCLYVGLHIEKGTHEWWQQQTAEARDALKVNARPLSLVVDEFHAWFRQHNGSRLWCQGANFDAVLWEHAARAVGALVPWKFYHVRDTRTLYDLAGFDPRELTRAGTSHHALDDALHQVACCRAASTRLFSPK